MILVTGGCGYIGSHTVVELLNSSYDTVVFDNLSNSSKESLHRVSKITGRRVMFVQGCITNEQDLTSVFQRYPIKAVVHFAGLKSVSDSIKMPLEYYHVNAYGTMVLLKVMVKFNCSKIIFSSSATVYGYPQELPITEDHPVAPINPYGWSKLHAEQVIKDVCTSNPNFTACLLRYFNPAGCHESALIGEDPKGTPNNLVPFLCRVLVGTYPQAHIFGNDYDTPDGTGVRDFIHVVDLAQGHVAALNKLLNEFGGCYMYNMGTGNGYSVMEMIEGMQQVSNLTLPYRITNRRPGDAGMVVADPRKANQELDWEAQYDLFQMCSDSWKWQSMNPNGFLSE